jgi:hypothetical protein
MTNPISEKVLNEVVIIKENYFITQNSPLPMAKLDFKTLRIVANTAWSDLPLHLKEATVAHEIGHREMGHASIPNNNLFFGFGLVAMYGSTNPKELEADRYACKVLGIENYLMGLRGMLNIFRRVGASNLTISEHEYRIKSLESKLN